MDLFCPQTWGHIVGFLKSTASISMTEGCVQICFCLFGWGFFSGFSLTMTLWNCCQFKHNWGLPNRQKTRLSSQHNGHSQSALCHSQPYFISFPKPAFLVTIFFYLFFKMLTLTWTHSKCAAASPSPIPSGKWWEKSNKKLHSFVSVHFPLLSNFLTGI